MNSPHHLPLQVDNTGIIVAVSKSPSVLFGFTPESLVGRSISTFIDVLRPTTGGSGCSIAGDTAAGATATPRARRTSIITTRLEAMAAGLMASPGFSPYGVAAAPLVLPVQTAV